jgi:hypothetical protein
MIILVKKQEDEWTLQRDFNLPGWLEEETTKKEAGGLKATRITWIPDKQGGVIVWSGDRGTLWSLAIEKEDAIE